MSDFEKAAMVIFVIIFMMNMTLLAYNTQYSGEEEMQLFGGGELMSNFDYNSMNTSFYEQTKDTGTDLNCAGNVWFCGTVNFSSEAVTTLTYGLSLAGTLSTFILNNISGIALGYHLALTYMADSVETGVGGVHLLVWGISGIIFIVFIFGAWAVVKSIVGIFRV